MGPPEAKKRPDLFDLQVGSTQSVDLLSWLALVGPWSWKSATEILEPNVEDAEGRK